MLKNIDASIRTDSTIPNRRNRWRRKGLAPLEMVLVLPFLMMLMAAIIVFGYAAMWKLRSETVARDGIWRQRFPRWANFQARPPEWPEPAAQWFENSDPISGYAGQDPLENPIIAGPLPQIEVDETVLDFTRDVEAGRARIIRTPPVFPTLVTLDFDVQHPILEDRFQAAQMGISNYARRIPVIWESPMDALRDSAGIQAAVDAIVNSTSWPRLEALDRDREFIAYYGSAPDFYPRAGYFSTTDHQWVEDWILQPLTVRIWRVPFRMGNATIGLYEQQLEDFPELQQTIDAIESWLSSLRGAGG